MIIKKKELLEMYDSLTSPRELKFDSEHMTTLVPVHYTPRPSMQDRTVDLAGVWKCRRWPFTLTEEAVVAQSTDEWETVDQPGKVFYSDPEGEAKEIKDWNRVTLSHIHPDDGAVIKRSVHIPSAWKGKKIFLRFDSIYPAGRVYCNNKLLGEHTSGLTPVEYDVTGLVTPGDSAAVAVRLLRRHPFVQLDMPRHAMEFAGLAQDACFFAVGTCYICDHHLSASLNKKLDTGTVSGTVRICNTENQPVDAEITLSVFDMQGKVIKKTSSAVATRANTEKTVEIGLDISKPQLWNDEFPNLYTVHICLQRENTVPEIISYQTGFRRFELLPSGPLLNGRPVKFRGVNHLTFHPEFGMYTPRSWLIKCLELMKKANVNAIRTHFLGPRCLADICNELGIYLLQELPIDWGTNYIHNPAWVGPALMRIEGGIKRDRHQPSVMVWSIGNENMPESAAVAEDGWNHLQIFHDFAKKLDPSRPTMFPPPGPANKITGIFETRVGDIADTHYSFNDVKEFLKTGSVTNPNSWEADMHTMTREEALARGWSGVFFSSEYGIFNMLPDCLHSPQNSVVDDIPEDPYTGKNVLEVFFGRLKREWGFLRHEKTSLGGAYFPWIAPGAGAGEQGNPWGWVRWGEDADWGVVCADLTPKPFFWVLRVLFSPVWFPERINWIRGSKKISFTVNNQYNAISLSECTLRVQCNPVSKWGTMMRKYREVKINAAPGESAEVSISLEENICKVLDEGKSAVCRIHLIDPHGFRPITADIMIYAGKEDLESAMPVGPDAVL